MHRVGALDELEARGAYMPSPRYLDRRGRVLARPGPSFPDRFPVLCLRRDSLMSALADSCERLGVDVRTGNVADVAVGGGGVSVRLSCGAAVDGDLLVGADGIHSPVRNAMLGLLGRTPKHASDCGYAYFRACLETTELPGGGWHGHAFESWGSGLRFGYVPLRPPETFFFCAVPITRVLTGGRDSDDGTVGGLAPMRGSRTCSEEAKAWLVEQFGGWGAPGGLSIDALLRGAPAGDILRTDIRKVGGVTRFPWRLPGGRVVLLGDAAHATAPNLAQGAGLAIEDAAELAAQLGLAADAEDWPAALAERTAAYEGARKPRAATVQMMADAVAVVGQLSGAAAAARDLAMRTASGCLPGLQQHIFEAAVSHSLGGSARQLFWTPPPGPASKERESDCLLAQVLGKAQFQRLPPHVREFRASPSGGGGAGIVSVDRGDGVLSPVVGTVAGMPRTMSREPFAASVNLEHMAEGRGHVRSWNASQRWTRVFGSGKPGATAYTTVHRATPFLGDRGAKAGCCLTETFGLWPDILRFGYRVTVSEADSALSYDSVGLWLGDWRIPLPRVLSPSSTWTEVPFGGKGDRAGWRFDGTIRLPPALGKGLLMRYWGEFEPHLIPNDGTRPGRVIVSGGTGLVGSAVCADMVGRGWEVIVLSRRGAGAVPPPAVGCRVVEWDGRTAGGWSRLINQDTVLVNLAGENPGGYRWIPSRWTDEVKDRILHSRLDAIGAFEAAVRASVERGEAPRLWLQASASGIYGDRGAEVLTEECAVGGGDDFRTKCCVELEAAAARAASGRVPLTAVRFGHVLASGGGLLPHLERASRFGVRRIGDGEQFVPWVHLRDAAAAVGFACNKRELWGTSVNVAAPESATNQRFLDVLAEMRQRRCGTVPVPAPVLRAVFGESATVILDSHRLEPQALSDLGFLFRYPDLRSCLGSADCL